MITRVISQRCVAGRTAPGGSHGLLEGALQVLASFAAEKASCVLIRDAGAVPPLCTILADPSNSFPVCTLLHASSVLSKLTVFDGGARQAATACDAGRALSQGLQNARNLSEQNTIISVARCIDALAKDEATLSGLAAQGHLPSIVMGLLDTIAQGSASGRHAMCVATVLDALGSLCGATITDGDSADPTSAAAAGAVGGAGAGGAMGAVPQQGGAVAGGMPGMQGMQQGMQPGMMMPGMQQGMQQTMQRVQ